MENGLASAHHLAAWDTARLVRGAWQASESRTSLTMSSTKTLTSALGAIVGAENVLSSGPDTLLYARDCWPRLTLEARDGFGAGLIRPLCVAQPGSEQEVSALVRFAEAQGVALVPYGAGSGVCGGAAPIGPSVTVDLKRLRHIDVDADAQTARVGPGVIGQHLEEALLRRGLTMGHYPSSLYCSSVGGYVAARSAGQYSSRYGKMEDITEALRCVVSGGEVIDTATAQRRWGLDVLPLLVGSEGTLGIITESTVRLAKAPQHRLYAGWLMPDAQAGTDAARRIMQAGVRPAVVRLYDQPDTLLGRHSARKPHGDPEQPTPLSKRLMKRAKAALGDAMARPAVQGLVHRVKHGLMTRSLGQPLALNKLLGMAPKKGCLMIFGLEGTQAEVEAAAAHCHPLLDHAGQALGPEPGEHWYQTRFKVSYKMSPTMDTGAFLDTMEVSTGWSNLMHLYQAVRVAMAPYALVLAHFSHVYPQGCSIYFTFAGFAPDHEALMSRYDAVWAAGLGAVAAAGGSVAHHHGVGQSKAPYMKHDHVGGEALFQDLKAALDPHGILNPGKVWTTATQ
jgi:alkyldihydroxyacetonephosphate synthase